MKRQGVEGVGGVGLQSLGHRALRYELLVQAERGGSMEIFAATGTDASPGGKHSRHHLLLAVMELFPL